MKTNELLDKYFDFFERNNHCRIENSSLIPENDPTVLFTTAGMHPLVPFLLGEKHPLGKRLCNVQRCIRTGDIEEVGDEVHHTFFEMLGYWSLGDYFKEEAIKLTFKFITEVFGFDKNRLAVSCFKGNSKIPRDEFSKKVWMSLGISEDRIVFLDEKENFWGPAGQTGPCGPDTEIFYYSSENDVPKIFDPNDSCWVEIGNDVFMQYNKLDNGDFEELKQKNVDFGMGLERVLTVSNGILDDYLSELFLPIIKEIESLSSKKYENYKKEMRIIADHIKAATMIIGDPKGVTPSKEDQGYVVRRLIRRSIRYAMKLGINKNFTKDLSKVVISIYQERYLNLSKNKKKIFSELEKEEEKFQKTLLNGLSEFEKIISKLKKK